MHVYISVDMEGVAGIATGDQVIRGGTGYQRAQVLMTDEANAAIRGALAAGADEVTVNDSHGTMDNLLHDRLDPRARVIFGEPTAQCMAHGLTPEHDVALYIGYHAPAGEKGVLSHTFSSLFSGYRLNGKTVSEAEVNALYAASLGVPVGLVTGDDMVCGLARNAFPGIETVEVKRAEGWSAADSVHPSIACLLIEEGARSAVRRAAEIRPIAIPDTLILEVVMQLPTATELAALVPGSEQVSPYAVRRVLDTPNEILGLTTVWYELAAGAAHAHSKLFSG